MTETRGGTRHGNDSQAKALAGDGQNGDGNNGDGKNGEDNVKVRPQDGALRGSWLLYALAVVVAVVFGVLSSGGQWKPSPIVVNEQAFTAFAVFFIAALAVERLMEAPAALFDPKTPLKVTDPEMKQLRANSSVVMGAAATLVATLVSGLLGLYLIRSVTAAGFTPTGLQVGVDVFVTGLAIGAGTKPLHDLIKRIEKAKEEAEK